MIGARVGPWKRTIYWPKVISYKKKKKNESKFRILGVSGWLLERSSIVLC